MDSKKLGLVIEATSLVIMVLTLGASDYWEVASNVGILPTVFSFLRIRLFPDENTIYPQEFIIDIKSIYILVALLVMFIVGEFLRRGIFTISKE